MPLLSLSIMDASSLEAYGLLLSGLSLIPISHYLVASLILFLAFLYNSLDFHFLGDVFSGFRGSRIGLTYHPCSPIYNAVVSNCKILHGRYLATPWLASPHLQNFFLTFFGRPPSFSYTRQIFQTSDGGTIALDWLLNSDVVGGSFHMRDAISKDDATPIVLVIPGLASDSDSVYIRHVVFTMAKWGWNVVVSNHRGLGGVSITSDCFYNAGWTEDTRVVIGHLHSEYPNAPLFAVGTSIGANILVKYLGEDGEKTPLGGAAAICNPWDLLIGDRFICRRLVQKIYDRVLTIGLQGYAKLHEPHLSRLANWEGIEKSRSIRDFDNHATCHIGKFETVDTYYRRCSSSYYVGNVAVPLLCISALDDPICTREAIPWDECRANKQIVLATPQHGGHLAFFEGLTAAGLWWVRAVNEFLVVLYSSPCMHVQKLEEQTGLPSPAGSSIDQGPFVNIGDHGMVAAVSSEQTGDKVENFKKLAKCNHKTPHEELQNTKREEHISEENSDSLSKNGHAYKQSSSIQDNKSPKRVTAITRCLNQILQGNRWSVWLLTLISAIIGWPLVGSVLGTVLRKKRKVI